MIHWDIYHAQNCMKRMETALALCAIHKTPKSTRRVTCGIYFHPFMHPYTNLFNCSPLLCTFSWHPSTPNSSPSDPSYAPIHLAICKSDRPPAHMSSPYPTHMPRSRIPTACVFVWLARQNLWSRAFAVRGKESARGTIRWIFGCRFLLGRA